MNSPISYCSMVIDDNERHYRDAAFLLYSLENCAGMSRRNIVVHCVDRVPACRTRALARAGYRVVSIPPFLDGRYCNKLRQLDTFVNAAACEQMCVYLLDLDLIVLSPLCVPDPDRLWGKIVDAPNPPLAVLDRIFAFAGVEPPSRVPCDWSSGDTLATNFNGGLYHIPGALIEPLRNAWQAFAAELHSRPDLFDDALQFNHVDQVSFSLAVAARQLPYGHLPANWNFPCHHVVVPRTLLAEEPIHVLHCHDRRTDDGGVAPVLDDLPLLAAAMQRVEPLVQAFARRTPALSDWVPSRC